MYKPFLYQYAVWATFGSAAIHLLWTKNEYREYKEKMDFKVSKLEDMIERLKRGENIDDAEQSQKSSIVRKKITTQPNVKSKYIQKEEKPKTIVWL
ncbi:4878_t:CDS:2 [Dentiscutata heterogama]|uniref:4878_t:CDS:1 n=1 Tax=Dentiscutata heterogama TaxID=1316150 RepID=A0ACA9PAK3_9GLOM|nr:4878_t:CDS:2 [Dentiscutata heterogama]